MHYFGAVERELRKTAVAGQTRETYKRMIGGVMQIVEQRTVNDSNGSSIAANATLKTEVMLKDHLGSTHLIINSDGTEPQYQRFDVWGMRADAGTGSTQSLVQSYSTNNPNDPSNARTRKGFTGHEMVDGAGIVHMQGRIYDPRLGRFLQADPIVQDPLNAQSYNRYTYVFNNPLSLIDPSGYRSLSANLELYWKPITAIAIVVATGGQAAAAMSTASAATSAASAATAVAGMTTGSVSALASGAAAGFSAVAASATSSALGWAVAGSALAGAVTSGTLRGAVTGAVEGGLTFGIGQAFKSSAALIAAHSLKGGMINAMNGGDFGHGMLSAGLSKVSGIGVVALERGPASSIILNAMAGGTVSAATGGKFANGAVSAAVQVAFNGWLAKIKGGGNFIKRVWNREANPMDPVFEMIEPAVNLAVECVSGNGPGCAMAAGEAVLSYLPVGDVVDVVEGAASLMGKALKSRDDELARIRQLSNTQRDKHTTVVGAYDPATGNVTSASKVTCAKNASICAEDIASDKLNNPKSIIFTPVVRPRDGSIIPRCPACVKKFGPEN